MLLYICYINLLLLFFKKYLYNVCVIILFRGTKCDIFLRTSVTRTCEHIRPREHYSKCHQAAKCASYR